MATVIDTISRIRSGRNAVPPFLNDATEGMLAVARELFEHPETVTLPDGRELSYAQTGDPDGDPLLVFHGVPSGRLGAAAVDRVAHEHGCLRTAAVVPPCPRQALIGLWCHPVH